MPVMGGLEALGHLHELDPAPPIVLFSAEISEQITDAADQYDVTY